MNVLCNIAKEFGGSTQLNITQQLSTEGNTIPLLCLKYYSMVEDSATKNLFYEHEVVVNLKGI